ncbi:MAG: metalloregulator ArsR/SmtB family transcription factor [Luteitalea sp.]|nr:metalloregulator ArsR/SmtB family transcription factor [Luteitalea sp.]
MKSLSTLCRLLGDEARLRLLRVLAKEQLNVKELTAILGIAQSGVSRHLGLLRDSGLVDERREAGFAYYGLRVDGVAERAGIWEALRRELEAANEDPIARADEARLREVLRLRKEEFKTHGGEAGQFVPGRSWAAWARALGHLLPAVVVADLGCGEGYLTVEAARWARRVIAVDRSKVVLQRARALARKRGVSNVAWRQGEIEHVPIDDSDVDVVLLSQALHHVPDPARALREAHRILKPGGRVLVLELREHDQTWVKERLGDQWLGFRDEALRALLAAGGFVDTRLQVGARLKGDPFTVLIASATKPGATRSGRARLPPSLKLRRTSPP